MRKEPIGVCGLITPWNWPVNQIACKVAPALAAGCTMVLKPSEIAPLSAVIIAEILHEAGVPKGVFNLVQGDGPTVGAAISSHPGIDMVSFTGSTRAGVQVAKGAADTVKRVSQSSGGKSPNIILDDADLARAVSAGVKACFMNSGQSCNAPTRMLVPRARQAEAIAAARAAAEETVVGDPQTDGVAIGPVVSEAQFKKIQGLIKKGIEEGAELVAGGPAVPTGSQGLLRDADGLRQRRERHDHRARGDLRTGPVDHPVRHGRGGRSDRQRHAVRALGLRPVRRHRARAARRRAPPHRQRPRERRPAPTSSRRSAATSNPATAANGAKPGLQEFLGSRPCSVTPPRAGTSYRTRPGRGSGRTSRLWRSTNVEELVGMA
jgi:aldehyde dehydrogenase (NAD+)